MENNRSQNRKDEPNSPQKTHQSPGSSKGFEEMNFEEQRSSYKNSDGAGAKGSEKGSRNGMNDRQDK